MWSNEKTMRRAERALKRTECYLESRAAGKSQGCVYELDYVLTKTDTAIAYAHCADSIIKFDPFKSDVTTQNVLDWSFSLDGDLFFYLESGYKLAGITLGTHYEAWVEISERHEDGINYLIGMQQYLHYCKQNRITVNYLRKEFQYDGLDVMALYDKATLKAKPI